MHSMCRAVVQSGSGERQSQGGRTLESVHAVIACRCCRAEGLGSPSTGISRAVDLENEGGLMPACKNDFGSPIAAWHPQHWDSRHCSMKLLVHVASLMNCRRSLQRDCILRCLDSGPPKFAYMFVSMPVTMHGQEYLHSCAHRLAWRWQEPKRVVFCLKKVPNCHLGRWREWPV